MIPELLIASHALALLTGVYAASVFAGRYWKRLLDEQTVMYEGRIAKADRDLDAKLLAYERQAMQLGAAVLAEKARAADVDVWRLRAVE